MTPGDQNQRDTPHRARLFQPHPASPRPYPHFRGQGYITLKSEPGTLTRYEFEYEIPKNEAIEIITRFSIEPIIVKTRHEVPY
jgi:hypothetical protein